MQAQNKFTESLFYPVLFLVFLSALFLNLGWPTITADEPIRTVVAQELDYNNNLFVSTIHGEFYYKKLPVYNWILLGFYKITGSKAEWVSRLPTVLSLLGFCAVIFFWLKQHTSRKTAWWGSLIFATGARIWFYDSMLGLIDMFFGLLVFVSFVFTFELERKKKFLLLFILTYTITAVCFLMKGLQAIAFQGATILVWFIYSRNFKKLFSWQHLAGIICFGAVLGMFFYFYVQSNEIQNLIKTLVKESDRTKGNVFAHLLSFPFKIVLPDILPWGLALLFLIKKSIRKEVFGQPIAVFSLVIFTANILVYWISPETRGRYLFPHYALLALIMALILGTDFVSQKLNSFGKALKVGHVLAVLLAVSMLVVQEEIFYQYFGLKRKLLEQDSIMLGVFIAVGFSVLSLPLIRSKKYGSVISLALILMVLRLCFNSVVIPFRMINDGLEVYKNEAIRIGKTYHNKPIYILGNTPINYGMTHYLMLEQDRSIPRYRELGQFKEGGYYLINKGLEGKYGLEILDSFKIEWGDRVMYVAEEKD